MTWRLIRSTACVTLCVLLVFLLYAGSQVPMPKGVGVAEAAHRSLRSASSLLGLGLLDGDPHLDAARDAVDLDPDLTQLGRRGAEELLANSPSQPERVAVARSLVDHAVGFGQLEAALLDAVGTEEPGLIAYTAARSQDLPDEARQRVQRAVVAAAHDHPEPELIEVGLNLLSADPSLVSSNLAAHLVDSAIDARLVDLLGPLTKVAASLSHTERTRVADLLVSDEVVAWIGDWGSAVAFGLAVERTPHILNEVGVRTDDLADQAALLSEAHELDPADDIIAANWAYAGKTLAISRSDFTNMAEFDRALDAGLALIPDQSSWAWARHLYVPPDSC